jgi:hypothetical protein
MVQTAEHWIGHDITHGRPFALPSRLWWVCTSLWYCTYSHEEVAGRRHRHVVADERSPALSSLGIAMPDHVLGNGGRANVMAEQRQLVVDTRSTPGDVLPRQPLDQVGGWSARASRAKWPQSMMERGGQGFREEQVPI